jgi:[ribosomal protein S5]-alanine N-acetyltransferase
MEIPMDEITLRTERLRLRSFRTDDFDAVHEYGSDPEVVRFMPWGPNTLEDTRDFVALAIASGTESPRVKFQFAVVLRDTDEMKSRLIGGCWIGSGMTEHNSVEIGYCLHRHVWGQGFGTELASALLRFGFEQLGLHRIFAYCDIRNVGSYRIMEKIGMQHEGHLRENLKVRDGWRDSYLYGILDREWRSSDGAQSAVDGSDI